MSHLGRRLSALVDGELGDAERDQALAHLVGCETCRGEAAALRTLKRRVRALGEAPADSGLTRRLMALARLPEAQPSRPRIPGTGRARAAFTMFSGGTGSARQAWDAFPEWLGAGPPGAAPAGAGPAGAGLAGAGLAGAGRAGTGPAGAGHPGAGPGLATRPLAAAARHRAPTRYLVAGAVTALAVGLGAASFAAGGGGQHLPGPTVTPEVDSYNVQHAATFGEMPALQSPGATRQFAGSLRP